MKKGPLHEARVVEWLRAHGFPYAERRVMGGANDRGDVAGIPGVVLELKACNRIELAAWVDEARAEAANANAPVWGVIAHRKGKGDPSQAYVITDLVTFAALLRDEMPTATDVAAALVRYDVASLTAAAQRVVGEWDQRGDGGCSRSIQDELRAALMPDVVSNEVPAS